MATGAPRGRETAAAAVAAVVATAVAGLSSVVVQVADGVAGYAVFVILVALALTLFWVAGRSLLRARASRPPVTAPPGAPPAGPARP